MYHSLDGVLSHLVYLCVYYDINWLGINNFATKHSSLLLPQREWPRKKLKMTYDARSATAESLPSSTTSSRPWKTTKTGSSSSPRSKPVFLRCWRSGQIDPSVSQWLDHFSLILNLLEPGTNELRILVPGKLFQLNIKFVGARDKWVSDCPWLACSV
jgi:hypothetical protein